MRIITGTGRSGTSFLAKLLVECGYDLGVKDYPHHPPYAGMENPEVAGINQSIMNHLAPSGTGYDPIHRLTPRWITLHADKYAPRIKTLPPNLFCKDPRFCVTLPVWYHVRRDIEFVLICIRDLHAVEQSAHDTNTLVPQSPLDRQRCFLEYGTRLGHLMTFAVLRSIPYRFIRFPHMVYDVTEILTELPEVEQEKGIAAIVDAHRRLADRTMVHQA